MPIQEMKERVSHFKEAVFNRRNFEVIDDFLAPDFRHHDPDHPEVRTRADYRKWVMGLLAAFPDFRVEVDELIGEADRIAVRWTAYGTHRNPFVTALGTIPPTGKLITVHGFTTYRFVGEVVVEDQFLSDNLTLHQTLGVVPSPRETVA